MNTNQMNSTKSFVSHMFKYLGVGLISGSIVHAGTLGGNITKYIILIILGVILFVIGNILEHGISSLKQLIPYIWFSTILSIGTGMVSGATQHYLDGPFVAAILLPLGVFLGYLSFIYRDYRNEFTFKRFLKITIVGLILFVALFYIAKQLPEGEGYGHDELQEVGH